MRQNRIWRSSARRATLLRCRLFHCRCILAPQPQPALQGPFLKGQSPWLQQSDGAQGLVSGVQGDEPKQALRGIHLLRKFYL
jgi:hypothetical protein